MSDKNSIVGAVKKRKANIELLRIISMLMVTTLHCLGELSTNASSTSINYYLFWLINALCFVAVNVFVLITGYFMVNSHFKFNKLIILWLEIFFYSVGLKLLSILLNLQVFNVKSILLSMIPILHKEYWFTSVYFILYLLVPVINSAIHKMNKEKMQICIFLLVFLFSIIPTLLRPWLAEVFNVCNGYSLDWFVVLYIIGAYLRLYVNPQRSFKYYFGVYFILTVITFLSKCMIEIIGNSNMLNIGKKICNLYEYNSFTVLLSSVFIFLAFTKLNIKENSNLEKIILFLSPCSIAVYLIHLNPNFRTWLWDIVVNVKQYYHKIYYIPYAIGSVLVVFLICCAIDLCRQYLFTKINTQNFRFICANVQSKLCRISIRIVEKVK